MSRGGLRFQFILWSIFAVLMLVRLIVMLVARIDWALAEYLTLAALLLAVACLAYFSHVRRRDGHFWDGEENIRGAWDPRGGRSRNRVTQDGLIVGMTSFGKGLAMNGRGMALLLAMIGLLSGIGLQLLIGSKLDTVDLVFASVAGMLALIVPVIASIPERKDQMRESPLYRRRMIFASAVALALAWIVLIILALLNGVELARAVLGMVLLSFTTCAWFIGGSASSNVHKKMSG
jgi:hypothetical protein